MVLHHIGYYNILFQEVYSFKQTFSFFLISSSKYTMMSAASLVGSFGSPTTQPATTTPFSV